MDALGWLSPGSPAPPGKSGADRLVSAGLDKGKQRCSECPEKMGWREFSGADSYLFYLIAFDMSGCCRLGAGSKLWLILEGKTPWNTAKLHL